MARSRSVFLSVLCVASLATMPALARELSFDERVTFQQELEAAYYQHQENAPRPFVEAVTREILERKVRDYLGQSALLAQFWDTEITDLMLRRELERIAADTQMPERLRELYAALDNDRFLVEECLARATLASRLAQRFYAYDERVHSLQRDEIRNLREQLLGGAIDPGQEHALRHVDTVAPADAGVPPELAAQRIELDPEEFERLAGVGAGTIGTVEEHREAFVLRVVLSQKSDELRVANYVVRKQPWDRWWKEQRTSLDWSNVEAVSRGGKQLPEPGGLRGGDCLADHTWSNGSLDDVPDPRGEHTAVWTGSLMLVWGGYTSQLSFLGSGGRYDPATDTWSAMATLNAPSPRRRHTAVWTGTEMIVWGGERDVGRTGGRYDPVADTWTPTRTDGAPWQRSSHTAVWTGDRMIVWGGYDYPNELSSGSVYDPATDTWSGIQGAGAPGARYFHTAVWTGSLMIVWGGRNGSDDLRTGGVYNPETDAWSSTSLTQAPEDRVYHTAVWSGTEMIVWGGYDYDVPIPIATGGCYNPETNSWRAMSLGLAPEARFGHSAVWATDRMLVWGGGHCGGTQYDTGAWYFPGSNLWIPISTVNAPPGACDHSAVWTGSEMIVWGGYVHSNSVDFGGRFDVLANSWTPVDRGPAPEGRYQHTAVWTGNRMIVWGGAQWPISDSGATYDPTTDSWRSAPAAGAPEDRREHSAFWTGDEMLIWGGFSNIDGSVRTDGGRYDPLTETWTPISTVGAPTERSWPSTVWAGDRMFVWSGFQSGMGMLTDGSYYRPSTDNWSALPPNSILSGRTHTGTVWTGEEVIVWGGWSGWAALDGGARYSPSTQSWLPVSDVDSPSPRSGHAAVWVDGWMIVWGGGTQTEAYDTGARYDPATDTWEATSTLDAPTARDPVVGIATNRAMLIWGIGEHGGYYRPDTDTWTPTSLVAHPSPRPDPSAVWTGGTAIYWGGLAGDLLRSGGCYAIEQEADVDQDGLTVCAGDCNDTDPTVFAHPFDIDDLHFSGKTTLQWSSDAPNSGPGTVYDVLIGDLADLPVTVESPDGCLENDHTETSVELDEEPRPGSGFYILVRGDNSCGPGDYGSRTDGAPRFSVTCP